MDAVCSGTETLECTGEASNLPAVVNIRFMNILQSTVMMVVACLSHDSVVYSLLCQ